MSCQEMKHMGAEVYLGMVRVLIRSQEADVSETDVLEVCL